MTSGATLQIIVNTAKYISMANGFLPMGTVKDYAATNIKIDKAVSKHPQYYNDLQDKLASDTKHKVASTNPIYNTAEFQLCCPSHGIKNEENNLGYSQEKGYNYFNTANKCSYIILYFIMISLLYSRHKKYSYWCE